MNIILHSSSPPQPEMEIFSQGYLQIIEENKKGKRSFLDI
jgi:hypothetical protein